MPMKRFVIFLIMTATFTVMQAQQLYVVSGVVKDQTNGKALSHVSVTIGGTGTVTNEQGLFTIKLNRRPDQLKASMLGYRTRRIALSNTEQQRIEINLQPNSIRLNEITVTPLSPEDIVRKALQKVPVNYSTVPLLYKGFYRETVQKRRQFISISEAVVDVYKTPYTMQNTNQDAVAITRGRRLLNMKPADTLGVKLMGGPTMPVIADVLKNNEMLFYEDDMPNYHFELDNPVMLGDRMQYVVKMTPHIQRLYALFFATLYIDQQTLAFTRVEMELDMSHPGRATTSMLVHKPLSLRFRPRELSFVIDYRTEQDETHLSYIRNVMRFNCDWKRKLFSSPFTVISEFVVTDRQEEAIRPIRGRDSFSRRDKLYDKVEYFNDPNFWGADNIIEPTESLDKAIERLKLRVKRQRNKP